MLNRNHYWRQNPDAPFAFFLRVIDTYLHPESGYDVDDLAEWLMDGETPEEINQFKNEFRQLLSGELEKVPRGALGTASAYEDGSDEAFLRRLWHELYGDESVQPEEPVS